MYIRNGSFELSADDVHVYGFVRFDCLMDDVVIRYFSFFNKDAKVDMIFNQQLMELWQINF